MNEVNVGLLIFQLIIGVLELILYVNLKVWQKELKNFHDNTIEESLIIEKRYEKILFDLGITVNDE